MKPDFYEKRTKKLLLSGYPGRGINMHTVFQPEAMSGENKRLIELEKMKKNLEYQLQEMAKTVEKQQEMLAMAKLYSF